MALLRLPQIIWHVLPFALQVALTLLFVVLQFVALFYFLSRGGVDVYFPDDIKTRFSDVWGQDHVLERVKENIIFLENPELVEEKGGYVPGRPAAVGTAGDRQDADGRGRRGRDRASPTCSSTPGRSSTCSWASASSR